MATIRLTKNLGIDTNALRPKGIYIKEVGPYAFEKKLGSGGFGTVYAATEFQGRKSRQVAAKEMPFEMDDSPEIRELHKLLQRVEYTVGKILTHPNLVKMHDFVDLDDSTLIVMDLVEGNDLYDVTFSEKEARPIIQQLVSAVHYLHGSNVAHRDIKVENVIYNAETGRATLIDYGLASFIGRYGQLQSDFGTIEYMAPELFDQKSNYYDPKAADVFALGVTFYSMLTGDFPFGIDDEDEIRERQQKNLLFPKTLSKGMKSLLSRMLERDPKKRATLEEVARHKLIKKGLELYEPCKFFDYSVAETVSNAVDSEVIQELREAIQLLKNITMMFRSAPCLLQNSKAPEKKRMNIIKQIWNSTKQGMSVLKRKVSKNIRPRKDSDATCTASQLGDQ